MYRSAQETRHGPWMLLQRDVYVFTGLGLTVAYMGTREPRKRMANKRDTDGHFYCMNFICFGRRDDVMNTLKVSGQPKRSIFSIKW